MKQRTKASKSDLLTSNNHKFFLINKEEKKHLIIPSGKNPTHEEKKCKGHAHAVHTPHHHPLSLYYYCPLPLPSSPLTKSEREREITSIIYYR